MPHSKSKKPVSNKKRWFRILRIFIGLLLIIAGLGWWALTNYVNHHKKELLQEVTTRINQKISGKLSIKDMQPDLWKNFPGVSIRLDSIRLTDSLYVKHHIPTVSLKSAYVKFNLFSLFGHHPTISQLTLSHGVINVFVLKNGYSNSYLFQKKKGNATSSQSHKGSKILQNIKIENVLFTTRQMPHNKRFKIDCKSITVHVKQQGNSRKIKATLDVFVHQLGFNLSKGSYLKNKTIFGHIKGHYNPDKTTLSFKNQDLTIEQTVLHLSALFNFSNDSSFFKLHILAPSLELSNGISMMPHNIAKKLKIITVQKPISLKALIRGGFSYPDTPLVNLLIRVTNNNIKTPLGTLSHTYFTSYFNNHVQQGHGRGDNNSGIFISHFKTRWMEMPIKGDSASIINLIHPKVTVRQVRGNFAATRINKVLGHSFHFKNGHINFDLSYSGPVTLKDTISAQLNGKIELQDADLTYSPRALHFNKTSADLAFDSNKVLINNLHLNFGKSTINVKGFGKNFLNAFLSGKDIALFNIHLNSPQINLKDFVPLLKPRQGIEGSVRRKARPVHTLNKKMDRLLKMSILDMHLNVKKLAYHQFTAHNLKGEFKITPAGYFLNSIALEQSSGHIGFNAHIRQTAMRNYFHLAGNLQQLKVDQLFHAFNNFGQTTLKANNIVGKLSAKFNINGELQENASLNRQSLNGQAHFILKNGELNDFPPFVTISKFAFKNRHLKHITFKAIQDTFLFRNGKMLIPQMDIISSAIYMQIYGIYGFGKGTDLSMKIPLRNPEKDRKRISKGLEPKRDKGIVLYLRAHEDKDGTFHISWDPLHKTRSYQDFLKTGK